MPNPVYTISYKTIDNVERSSKKAMQKYLSEEEAAWEKFIEYFILENTHANISDGRTSTASVNKVYSELKSSLENSASFNRRTTLAHLSKIVPPPSASKYGQLILSLFDADQRRLARCTFLSFILQEYGMNRPPDHITYAAETGRTLFLSTVASEALPLGKTSSTKMSAIVRQANDEIEELRNQIEELRKLRNNEESRLEKLREGIKEIQEKELSENAVTRNSLEAAVKEFLEAQLADVTKAIGDTKDHTKLLTLELRQENENRQAEHSGLVKLFYEQLKTRAPVELWAKREILHDEKSKAASKSFFILASLTAILGALIPWFLGDNIARAFVTEICDSSTPPLCSTRFSAQGPLIISGLLVASSILLWLIRLQYRVHLSERHLSLDASEKKAFAETFLAMKEGADVSAANETIILQSLFRPTQDGIIKDDESGFDFSAAALLAKQLGRDAK
jgi:hypothetical protein